MIHEILQTGLLSATAALTLAISYFGYFGKTVDAVTGKTTYTTLAWPWFIPVGSLVAFSLGWLLARRRNTATA